MDNSQGYTKLVLMSFVDQSLQHHLELQAHSSNIAWRGSCILHICIYKPSEHAENNMKRDFAGVHKKADGYVRSAIRTALTPAARIKPSQLKPHSFALYHSDRHGSNSDRPFTAPSPGHCMVDLYGVYLCAVWDPAVLAREYDMKTMAEPAVHASAAADILAGKLLSLMLLHCTPAVTLTITPLWVCV